MQPHLLNAVDISSKAKNAENLLEIVVIEHEVPEVGQCLLSLQKRCMVGHGLVTQRLAEMQTLIWRLRCG